MVSDFPFSWYIKLFDIPDYKSEVNNTIIKSKIKNVKQIFQSYTNFESVWLECDFQTKNHKKKKSYGVIKILEMPRWGIAQNLFGTTVIELIYKTRLQPSFLVSCRSSVTKNQNDGIRITYQKLNSQVHLKTRGESQDIKNSHLLIYDYPNKLEAKS